MFFFIQPPYNPHIIKSEIKIWINETGYHGNRFHDNRSHGYVITQTPRTKVAITMEQRFLTSSTDLKKIISACPKCFKTIHHGKNIVSHTNLPQLKLPINTTTAIICNTAEFKTTYPIEIGHWFLLFRPKSNIKCLYLCDSLELSTTMPIVMKNIKLFCSRNNLKLVILSLKSQLRSSMKCGIIVSFFLQLATHSSINHILALQTLFKTNSVKTNEILALKRAQAHLKFKLSQFLF